MCSFRAFIDEIALQFENLAFGGELKQLLPVASWNLTWKKFTMFFMGEDLRTVRSLFSELSIFQTHHFSQDWSTDLFRQGVLHRIGSLLHLEYSKVYN